MKKLFVICFVAMIGLTSCGVSDAFHCPTYSHHNKKTYHGHKAQNKYHKKSSRKNQSYALAFRR